MSDNILEMRDISKDFFGVYALESTHLSVVVHLYFDDSTAIDRHEHIIAPRRHSAVRAIVVKGHCPSLRGIRCIDIARAVVLQTAYDEVV